MMAAYYKWALIYEINNELGETFYNTAAIWRRWIQNELSIHECIQMATNGYKWSQFISIESFQHWAPPHMKQ